MAALTQVSPTTSASDSWVETDAAYKGTDKISRRMLIITNAQTGRTIQLGDQHGGDAALETISDKYIIWQYSGDPAPGATLNQAGLYAYNLQADAEVLIHPITHGYSGDVHLDGEWLSYIDNSDTGTTSLMAVHVHNLVSGEDITLSKTVPVASGYFPKYLHDINEGKVAWVDLDSASGRQVVRVFDLSSRQTQAVAVPLVNGPYRLSVSAHYLVWQDAGWHGYDLLTNSSFTVPAVPPIWATTTDIIDLVTRSDRLEWHLRHAPPGTPFFAADIVPNK